MPFLKDFLSSPENGEKAVQSLEYGLEAFKRATRYLSVFESDLACDSCQAALAPLDAFCNNLKIRQVLVEIVAEVCVIFKVEGGERAVCEGTVEAMADSVMPALA